MCRTKNNAIMYKIPDHEEQVKVFNYMREVPYDVMPDSLYTASELYDQMCEGGTQRYEDCFDKKVYDHFIGTGKHANTEHEMFARALHDFSIGKHLDKYLKQYDRCKVVGVMGGHALLRTDSMYREIVLMSKQLTEHDSLMVTGGGPGAMEATHLGAWLAGRTADDVDVALSILAAAPSFRDEGWCNTAFEVIRRFPQNRYRSLGLPTWLYGHEPSAPFATDIAKWFDNSIREDSILTIAFGGIIFTPGSAGTMQEVFQEAVQNHYLSFGISSPMVFLGKQFWTEDIPVYPFLQELIKKGRYKNLLLSLTDSSHEAVDELMRFREMQNV